MPKVTPIPHDSPCVEVWNHGIMAAAFWCPYLSSPFPYQPYLSSERQDALHGKRVMGTKVTVNSASAASGNRQHHLRESSICHQKNSKIFTAAQSQVTSHIKPTFFLDPRIALILKWTWSASKSSSLPTWCICICFSQSIHDCPGWPASQRCQRYLLRPLRL